MWPDHFHFANMKYHFQKARHFAKELPVTRLNVQSELDVAMRHLVALETEMEEGEGDGAVSCSCAGIGAHTQCCSTGTPP